MRLFPLLAILACLACGKRDVPVEHVKYNAKADQFELGITQVTTFKNRLRTGDGLYHPDVNGLEGDHVVVKGGGMLASNLCLTADAKTVTRDEFYKLGVVTAPVRVNLQTTNRPDGTYMATEHDSLSMLTAYVNFDAARAYFHDVIGDRTRATETRAVLAFYSDIAVGCGNGTIGVGLPVANTDNAAYLGNADLFMILRDNVLSTGLEMGSNPGVAFHEFGHRVFQQNVYASDGAFRMLVLSILGSTEEKAALCVDEVNPDNADCLASNLLLRGMDEGTADIFAYTGTGKADFFFVRSINPELGSNEALLRDLSRTPVAADGELPIYNELVKAAAGAKELQYYRLGTLWARGYYQSIVDPVTGRAPASEEERVTWARQHYGPAVLRAEGRLGEDFSAPSGTRPYNYRFDPRQLIRRYIQEVTVDPVTGAFLPQVRDAVCQEMCDRFGEMDVAQILNNAPSVCGGFVGHNDYSTSVLGFFSCTL